MIAAARIQPLHSVCIHRDVAALATRCTVTRLRGLTPTGRSGRMVTGCRGRTEMGRAAAVGLTRRGGRIPQCRSNRTILRVVRGRGRAARPRLQIRRSTVRNQRLRLSKFLSLSRLHSVFTRSSLGFKPSRLTALMSPRNQSGTPVLRLAVCGLAFSEIIPHLLSQLLPFHGNHLLHMGLRCPAHWVWHCWI
jgi:hypothetical protein